MIINRRAPLLLIVCNAAIYLCIIFIIIQKCGYKGNKMK